MPLSQFAPLAGVPGVVFVSLQKGGPAIQAKTPPQEMRLLDWTDELEDFSDTAALVECLDLVISVDTAVAHLAGALGKPVWMLNRFDSCWRWFMDREDSPWYPTMRLFRQTRFMEWEPVMARVREQLELLAAPQRGKAGSSSQYVLYDPSFSHPWNTL
jgi:ADP-heptose:LPS heptosyltransferase